MITDEESFLAWLDESHGPTAITRRERICFLVAANGGFEMVQFGNVTHDKDGNQIGLDASEAMELVYWRGFFDCLDEWNLPTYSWFKTVLDQYISNAIGIVVQ